MTLLIEDNKRAEWIRMSGIPDALEILGVQVEEFSEKAKRENMKFKQRNRKNVQRLLQKGQSLTKPYGIGAHEDGEDDEEEKSVQNQKEVDDLTDEEVEGVVEEVATVTADVQLIIDNLVADVIEPIFQLVDDVEKGKKDAGDAVGELAGLAEVLVDEILDPLVTAIDEIHALENGGSDDVEAEPDATIEMEQDEDSLPVGEGDGAVASEVDQVVDIIIEDVVEPLMEITSELQKSLSKLNSRLTKLEKGQQSLSVQVKNKRDLENVPNASLGAILKQKVAQRINGTSKGFEKSLSSNDELLRRKPREATNRDTSGFNGFVEGL